MNIVTVRCDKSVAFFRYNIAKVIIFYSVLENCRCTVLDALQLFRTGFWNTGFRRDLFGFCQGPYIPGLRHLYYTLPHLGFLTSHDPYGHVFKTLVDWCVERDKLVNAKPCRHLRFSLLYFFFGNRLDCFPFFPSLPSFSYNWYIRTGLFGFFFGLCFGNFLLLWLGFRGRLFILIDLMLGD